MRTRLTAGLPLSRRRSARAHVRYSTRLERTNASTKAWVRGLLMGLIARTRQDIQALLADVGHEGFRQDDGAVFLLVDLEE